MAETINLAILEDYQATIDGYIHRLSDYPNIKIVGSCLFSECLKSLLKKKKVDMLILDINVPISEENRNIQPIHQLLAELKHSHPELLILVISMHSQRAMIKSILESGISGYILKDDYDSIRNLARSSKPWQRAAAISAIVFGISSSTVMPLTAPSPRASWKSYRSAQLIRMIVQLYWQNGLISPTQPCGISLHKIYLKLQVHGRAAAILKAQEMGLIPSISSPQDNQNG